MDFSSGDFARKEQIEMRTRNIASKTVFFTLSLDRREVRHNDASRAEALTRGPKVVKRICVANSRNSVIERCFSNRGGTADKRNMGVGLFDFRLTYQQGM